MTNEEKAQEIKVNDVCCVWNGGCPNVYNAAMVMAEWKESQMIEKACEWLNDNLASFWQCKLYDDIAFIDNFKKVMKK